MSLTNMTVYLDSFKLACLKMEPNLFMITLHVTSKNLKELITKQHEIPLWNQECTCNSVGQLEQKLQYAIISKAN